MLRPIKNSLHGSDNNTDPVSACKLKVVVPADFLASAQACQVVVKKQDSSFQNWEVSRIPKIYSSLKL